MPGIKTWIKWLIMVYESMLIYVSVLLNVLDHFTYENCSLNRSVVYEINSFAL